MSYSAPADDDGFDEDFGLVQRLPHRVLIFPGKFDPLTVAQREVMRRLVVALDVDVVVVLAQHSSGVGAANDGFTMHDRSLVCYAALQSLAADHKETEWEIPTDQEGKPLVSMPSKTIGSSWHDLGVSFITGEIRPYEQGLASFISRLDHHNYVDTTLDHIIVAMGADEIEDFLESPDGQEVSSYCEIRWFPRDTVDDLPIQGRLLIETADLAGITSGALRTDPKGMVSWLATEAEEYHTKHYVV